MNRKDPRNFGTEVSEERSPPDDPPLGYQEAAGKYSIVMPERVMLALLRSEVTRLAKAENIGELRRFFGHFFDPMITEDERESYVTDFQRQPPLPRLGYPRTGAEFPCYAIVMESDEEDQAALAGYLGQTQPGDPADEAEEYKGSMFEQTYGIYVFAQHPDVCLYLYHFAKAVMLGSKIVLAECGIIDPHFGGSEMTPQEQYLPENMFVRRLGVTVKTLHTVPLMLRPDPASVRVTGVWANDTVVSGIRGGVTPRKGG